MEASVAAHMVPSMVVPVPSIPSLPNGKTARRELRGAAEAFLSARAGGAAAGGEGGGLAAAPAGSSSGQAEVSTSTVSSKATHTCLLIWHFGSMAAQEGGIQ